MHARQRSLTTLLAPVLLLATTACGNLALKQDLSDEVLEVRTNREKLVADWQSIENRLTRVESDLVAFGDMEIRHDEVDTDTLRSAIEVTEETTAEDASNSVEAIEARAVAYKRSLETLDDQARAEVEQYRQAGQALRSELMVGLPDAIKAITMEAGNAAIDLASVKATADQLDSVAESNPLMTSEDRETFNRDHAALDVEIDSLRNIVDRITKESVVYGDRITAASTTFQLQLNSLR